MERILTICPSRGRYLKLDKMLRSFNNTSSDSDIVVAIDFDDPEREQYQKIIRSHGVGQKIVHNMTYTQILNKIFNVFPDYQYYHITNDDFVYRTMYWDKEFIEVLREKGYGIAYGNDLYMQKTLPVAPCITGNIVRALDWVQLPTLTHLCGDMVWKSIGEKIKSLHYLKDVIIEHEHPFTQNKEIAEDETFKKTNSKRMYSRDCMAYREWVRNDMYHDIEKIKKAI